jgi:hypothetical protein
MSEAMESLAIIMYLRLPPSSHASRLTLYGRLFTLCSMRSALCVLADTDTDTMFKDSH